MKMICKWGLGVFLAATLCLWVAAPAAHAINVRLELSASTITVGNAFDMNVFVDGVYVDDFLEDEIVAFGFDTAFADTDFVFNDATVAAPFIDDSALFDYTQVAGSFFPSDPFEPGPGGDNILLASLNFTALQSGVFSLGLFSDYLRDGNEGLFTFGGTFDLTSNTEVSVAAAPVPEPGTMVLMLMGIGGLSLLKRRRA